VRRVPAVSVVIPTRDRRDLLGAALSSVLGQSGVDLEVLVVDDGSSDGTAEMVTGLRDGRVRLLRRERAGGVSAARNRGIAEATGGWIALLDDDDLWAPDKLARQLDAMEAVGRAWGYAGAVEIDADGGLLGGAPPPPPDALGLDHFTILLPDPDALETVCTRLTQAGHAPQAAADGLAVRDPAGNTVTLTMPANR